MERVIGRLELAPMVWAIMWLTHAHVHAHAHIKHIWLYIVLGIRTMVQFASQAHENRYKRDPLSTGVGNIKCPSY